MTPVLRHERSTAYGLALLFQGVSYMSYTGLGWGRVDTSFEQYLYISNKPMEGSTPLMRLSRSGGGGGRGGQRAGRGAPWTTPGPSSALFPTSFGAPGHQLRISGPPPLSQPVPSNIQEKGVEMATVGIRRPLDRVVVMKRDTTPNMCPKMCS